MVGNTSTRETIEQISEGYKRLEMAQNRLEDMAYAKRVESLPDLSFAGGQSQKATGTDGRKIESSESAYKPAYKPAYKKL